MVILAESNANAQFGETALIVDFCKPSPIVFEAAHFDQNYGQGTFRFFRMTTNMKPTLVKCVRGAQSYKDSASHHNSVLDVTATPFFMRLRCRSFLVRTYEVDDHGEMVSTGARLADERANGAQA